MRHSSRAWDLFCYFYLLYPSHSSDQINTTSTASMVGIYIYIYHSYPQVGDLTVI